MKQDIYHILLMHNEDNPIKRKFILLQLNLPATSSNDRKVRLAIQEMRQVDGIPVLMSTSSTGGGYYLPSNYDALKAGISRMRSYLIAEAKDIAALKHLGARYLQRERQMLLV